MQTVITDDQARLVAKATALALENSMEEQIGEDEDDLKRLAVFFTAVADEPSRFPVSGRMASRIKRAVRQTKGPEQPLSRKRKRSQSQQKRDRAARRAEAENYNQARERVEQDMREAEEFQAENIERLETLLSQPRLQHEELVEMFARMGATELAQKAIELRTREDNPQAVLDAAAARQKAEDERFNRDELDLAGTLISDDRGLD